MSNDFDDAQDYDADEYDGRRSFSWGAFFGSGFTFLGAAAILAVFVLSNGKDGPTTPPDTPVTPPGTTAPPTPVDPATPASLPLPETPTQPVRPSAPDDVIALAPTPLDPADPERPTLAGEPASIETPLGPDVAAEPGTPAAPPEPEDPGQPADPTNPTVPVIPIPIPVDPTTPVDPTIPVDPTTPVDPTIPVDPTTPVDPTIPVDPTTPADPTIPVDPTTPVDPTIPVDPTTPVDPTIPVDPVQPADPLPPVAPMTTLAEMDPMERARNQYSYLFRPSGSLVAGSGQGRSDETVYAPGMQFPLEDTPSFPNSQVWGAGGFSGPGGGQCSFVNYSFPWRDNFCETRGYSADLCPTGKGHQGQDIRPKTCTKAKHWVLAVEEGRIAQIGTYTVTLLGKSGREYRYMHMDMRNLLVETGDQVKRSDRLGKASNDFGGTATTIHLHFEIRQVMRDSNGRLTKTFVPPYASLKDAYLRLLIAGKASIN